MKFFASVATIATLAAAAPKARFTTSLDVKLELQENSRVKATVTNPGQESLKVLKTGSILDASPVQKVSVSNIDGAATFQGIKVYIGPHADESAFQEIPAGKSVEVTFDIAEIFDLSTGGKYNIYSSGNIRYAEGGDIDKLRSVSFESNKLHANVDGTLAAAALSSFHQNMKRATINSDCTGSRRQALETARQNTYNIAVKAAEAARSGPAKKMTEYFESASQNTRSIVAGTFSKMAQLYSSQSGKPDIYCRDIGNYCSGGVVAYTLPPQNNIVYCSAWFSYPALNSACRQVDQAHISVHESTHLSLTKGTDDYGTYGYENSIALPASQNINHADTYAYFAHDTLSGC
ncbi:hypothetical protein QQS21_004662 [Conoideocrella luteorostrata]|uniref:Neutral protease 2 n=1 Tax=Conoideocrella luteorostrata TaxID=1105319 RepID=A0AAJ0CV24_9HYPO|nr:hypothetical protein QQS21_004662 [Conoideocrella luteorostrata]